MKAFDYAIAENESGALEAMKHGFAIKAGGIDMLDLLKERTAAPDKVVSIRELDALKGIRETEDGVSIGALTTLEEIATHPVLKRNYPVVADSVANAASAQLRSVATAAGNLCQRPRCWYFRSKDFDCLKKGGGTCFAREGENRYHGLYGSGPCYIVHASNLAPAIVAAGGEIVIKNAKETRKVAAEDFFVLPQEGGISHENILKDGDLITGILLPKPPVKSAYVDFKEKQSFDWPLAACAVAYDGKKWHVILGAVAPAPWRAKAAEEALSGQAEISEKLAEGVAEAALEGAEPMRDNAWRLKLVRAAVRRALLLADGKEAV